MIFVTKFKNTNIAISVIFLFFAMLWSLYKVIYIVDRYPVSSYSIFLFVASLCLFLAAAMLFAGILASKKPLIMISSILLLLQSLIFSAAYIYKSSYSIAYNSYYNPVLFLEIIDFIFILLPAVSFLLLMFYLFGIIKNTSLIFNSLFISWILLLISYGEITPELLIVSSFILLMKYVDIANPSAKVKMGDAFLLTIVTFGVFYIIWSINLAKKTEFFIGKKASFSELWLFSLFYPYSAYWYYTRYEELSEANENIKNRGVICMVLSLVFLFPMALCIMQRDLNSLAETAAIQEANAEESGKETSASDVTPSEEAEYTLFATEGEAAFTEADKSNDTIIFPEEPDEESKEE